MKRKLTIVGIAVLLFIPAAWQLLGHRTPVGQAALVNLNTANFGEFEKEFSAAADKTRIVALLSPT